MESSSYWRFNDCSDSTSEFQRSCDHTELSELVAKQILNVDALKSFQNAALNAALLKHNTFVIVPTGAGKSLVYQLTGLISKGVTIIISPLISLIKEQVKHLIIISCLYVKFK
jgi:superfamily II DNA helicase RecQ